MLHIDQQKGQLAEAWCNAATEPEAQPMAFCLVGSVEHSVGALVICSSD